MVVKFKDFIDYSKRLGKILISGIEGSGKTLLLARIAVGKMLNGLEDCWKSWDEVDYYNSLGMNLSKNYSHLCATNFPVNCAGTEIPFEESYVCNPYKLGLFRKDYDTNFHAPYTLFCLTEGYNFLNSYLYDKFHEEFKGWLKTCRQAKYGMAVDCHSFSDICTIFRRLTNRFIYLYKPVEDIKDKYGFVIGHKLFVYEWDNYRDAELFERTAKCQNCKQYELVIDMCMHDNYDTNYCKFLHLVGRKLQDFFVQHFEEINNVDQIEGLLESFGTIPLEGFFKTSKSQSSVNREDKKMQKEDSCDFEFYFDGGG